MIDMISFREYCADLMNKVNGDSELKIDGLFLGVREEHLVSKLKDAEGICLCVSYPDAESGGQPDYEYDLQQAFFFIVEKVNPGDQTPDEEISHYSLLQGLMRKLRENIRDYEDGCFTLIPEESFRIEFEYRIFGGYNGLSMNVKFKDYD